MCKYTTVLSYAIHLRHFLIYLTSPTVVGVHRILVTFLWSCTLSCCNPLILSIPHSCSVCFEDSARCSTMHDFSPAWWILMPHVPTCVINSTPQTGPTFECTYTSFAMKEYVCTYNVQLLIMKSKENTTNSRRWVGGYIYSPQDFCLPC